MDKASKSKDEPTCGCCGAYLHDDPECDCHWVWGTDDTDPSYYQEGYVCLEHNGFVPISD